MKRILWVTPLLLTFLFTAVAQPRDKSSTDTRQDLIKLTDQITLAKFKKDAEQLGGLLTDDFILTNPAGFVANRSEYLDGVKADTATYESVTNREQVVSVYDSAAVVTGSTVVKGKYDGHDIGGEFRFTNVFIRQQGVWRCAATQLTRVIPQG